MKVVVLHQILSFTKLLSGKNGILSLDQIKNSVNPDDPHYPKTKLVCLENTVNKGGEYVIQ